MTTNTDLVRRHVESFNAGDAAALLADFAPRATWVTGDYAVPAGELREFFETAMAGLTPQLELVRVIDGGHAVAAEMVERWRHEGEDHRAALLALFDVAAGRITRAKIYREGSADA